MFNDECLAAMRAVGVGTVFGLKNKKKQWLANSIKFAVFATPKYAHKGNKKTTFESYYTAVFLKWRSKKG